MPHSGTLIVIAGPMFCGKTEELIRRVRRAVIGKRKVQVFKHALDTRYRRDGHLCSHDGVTFRSQPVRSCRELLRRVRPATEIVAVDEAQWFGEDLVAVINELLGRGLHVLVSGLALTFDRQPFAPIPTLMALADQVIKLSSVCTLCGQDAVFHKRLAAPFKVNALVADPKFVSKLDLSIYQARCRRCYARK